MYAFLSTIGGAAGAVKRFAWRHPIALTISGIILIPFVILLVYIFKPEEPQYITALVERGDLVQKVEAVGTITSDHDVNMRFPITGIVSKVLVHEGDIVTTGQELVILRNEAYVADVAAAAAQLQSERAALRELEEGTRPEDIAIAEADVANKRAALEAAKSDLASAEEKLVTSQQKLDAIERQAATSLAGYITTAASSCAQQIALGKTALKSLDDVFIDSTVSYLAERYDTTANSIFKTTRANAARDIDAAAQSLSSGFGTYRDALATLGKAHTALTETTATLQQAYDLVSSLTLTSGFTSTTRETYKSSIATQKASAQTALSAIDSATKSLQDSAASYDASITTEETNLATAQATKKSAETAILTYQTALQSQEAALALKKAGPRQTAIDGARADVNAAAANLSRARAKLEDTIIRAPVDGTITKVDFKEGEFTGDAANANHAVAMLGSSPFRVEMFLSEVDIPKVALTQSGSIELDAFPGVHYALRTSSIEPGPTEIDGVAKYRVTLNFIHPHEEFKIGMTGDAEIVTGERQDVLLAPSRAIVQSNGSGAIIRVLERESVVEKSVITGMEGDTDMEIMSGLQEGETVIVLIKK